MADLMKRILEMIEAEQARKGSNHGTSNSHNTYGSGSQNGSTINSGNHHNNGNWYDDSYHYGERPIYNDGTFNGNGNGAHVEGGFDSSTRNYYGRRYGY
ncbi:hypothetical protein JHK82_042292 [Glycine max]|uniref:Uncharacterized protein n=1 Tax=Glycine soja TaxID=3848 RepID=A0A0B2PZC6_GLYSO|nr:hypothetical protein JHK87_042248 [Glycine soja]KAG4949097.1 hypothetical protein JHK86_042336 [Glycine max]KAG4956580.1 hypothetical protein JHK85_042960 [Glycine max]KAG5105322.1 hypothetical protein JHK82_042292 [Glycine max]KAG5116447.1 hypothetical protein JHK84_042560 [Glycine max]